MLIKVIPSLLKDVFLVFLGDGPLRPQLERLASHYEVRKRVVFMGQRPNYEVIPILKECDVAVVPIRPSCQSYYFSLPNKFLDALAAGVPVVCSDLPEMTSIVRQYGCGSVFSPSDEKSLAEALICVLNNLPEYKERAKACAHLFTWDSEKAKLLQIYKELLMS